MPLAVITINKIQPLAMLIQISIKEQLIIMEFCHPLIPIILIIQIAQIKVDRII